MRQLTEFQYKSLHRPSGKQFKGTCKAISRLIFLEWINAWNHNNGDWIYYADIRTNGGDNCPIEVKTELISSPTSSPASPSLLKRIFNRIWKHTKKS